VVFPTPQTKHLISNLAWQGGDIINISIGQGDVLVTPLQATMAYCAIANRGTLYEPRVAQRVVSPDGTLIEEFEPVVAGTIEASTRSWDVAQEGLWQVVNKGGTGRRILDDKIVYGPDHPKMIPLEIEIVGKTGTAEIPPKPSHAWFVCYANKPFEIPEIVITVLVENAGHGGEVSAPMAKKILDIYFNRVNLENSV